jgi:hypothetical protein
MNLFMVENYPKCDIKDKIILKLLEELADAQRSSAADDYEWNLAFDLELMRPIWTKLDFVTYYIPHSVEEIK